MRAKGVIVGSLGVLGVAGNAAWAQTEVPLRLLETTDIHVHLVDYDYYRDAPSVALGLARTATLIAEARDEARNTLLIDNGDLIQGNPLGDFVAKERGLEEGEVHPVYKAMNLLGYDVGNIGNHEFNYGLPFLLRTLEGADFPYVSANVFAEDDDDDPTNDQPLLQPYVILERTLEDATGGRHPIRIGVIGFVPPQIMQWDKPHLEGKVVAGDMVEAAERYVPEMRAAGADLVVAVPHSGIGTITRDGMEENATYDLSKVEGIDALMFGHSHTVFPGEDFADIEGADIEKGTLNGVPAVMPGFWGSHLGVIDLDLEVAEDGTWRVLDGRSEARAISRKEGRDDVALVEPDPRIVEAVKDEHEATVAFMRQGVGEISAPINSYFALVQDDPSIQIVTDAQKDYVERLIQGTEYEGLPVLSAGAPFKAGGRGGPDYYTDIPKGEIALKNVADLYIYPNTLRAVTLDGAGVREWLEMSAGAFNTIDPNATEPQPLLNPDFPSYNFDVIDGVSYQIDVTQPPRYDAEGNLINPESHRIVDLRLDGEPIDPEQTFVVATNSYRASGGGNFPGLDGSNVIIEAPDENRTVLANSILDQATIDPSADGNWSFASIEGDAVVTFESSPAAADALAGDGAITPVGEAEDGFMTYRLDL